ncbi:c-type cytochrome [Bacteriovorax sp. Seq25_V]|uniref:c-type cytochrome n=1 Tax=Bacteriovorax sp. Seq25_V TaxID=1201288 RepID=UPI00038A4487|nr:c-type cytochrome [Bacteriovorax sp. Seq25_V]EQC45273.1 cytochrome C [Bacteriovorax sp. Seq25_V]
MTRLVIFCLFLSGLAIVMNFSSYNDIKLDSDRFNMEAAEKAHEAHVEELAELAKMHAEATTPKVISDDVVVEEKPLVELVTPALVRADKLYKQCIACHGKGGEGKSANKAPGIGGQFDWYISKQLTDMRDGVRVNQQMLSIVRKLSDQDIADLSAYVSKLPWGYKK